jgi:hypothetical protein
MNYYEVACLILGNLFFLVCCTFVGFFAVYGTYKVLSKIPLWENIRDKFFPKEKTCVCEYGKYKYEVGYWETDPFRKKYVVMITDLQMNDFVNNMSWVSDFKTARKRFKKICRDFNKCAPWVVAMVDSQISRSKMDV